MTPTNTQGSEQEDNPRYCETCKIPHGFLVKCKDVVKPNAEQELMDHLKKYNWSSDKDFQLAVIAFRDFTALIKSDREATTVNRFEVINHLSDGSGREVVVWNGEPFKVETSLQDQGQTLKVFLTDVAQLSKEDSNHA